LEASDVFGEDVGGKERRTEAIVDIGLLSLSVRHVRNELLAPDFRGGGGVKLLLEERHPIRLRLVSLT